jgi:hypothetical protein
VSRPEEKHQKMSTDDERFQHYQRDAKVEEHFGQPDHAMWRLYEAALEDTDKNAILRALHVTMAALGRDIEYARGVLNTYTLALYLKGESGKYTSDAHNNRSSYSEPPVYGWIYGTGQEFKLELHHRTSQLDVTETVLESAWAAELIAREGRRLVVERCHDLQRKWA